MTGDAPSHLFTMSNSANAPPAPAVALAALPRATSPHHRFGPGFAFNPPSPGFALLIRTTASFVRPREGAERREALVRIAAPLVPHDAGHRDACEASPRPSDVGALASRRSTAASSTHRARRLTPEASAPVLMPGGGIPRSPERGVVSPARRRRSPLRPGIPSGRRPHRAGMSAIIPMRGPLSRRKVPKIRNKIPPRDAPPER